MITRAEDVLQSRIAAALLPVRAGAPAGDDARFDPEHEALQREIGKLIEVQGETPNWAKVERDGLTLLTTRSKDLLVAAYVCAALLERNGYDGLIEGLGLVTGLLTNIGSDLHPKRARARANALGWLLDRIELALTSVQPSPAQWQAAHESALALRTAAEALLGDEAPSLNGLLRALDRVAPATGMAEASTVSGSPTAVTMASGPEARKAEPAGLAALVDDWLLPISSDAPAGIDTSYHDAQLTIRHELDKLQSVSGELPQWQAVFAAADGLLRTETKDLMLASYLTAALLELRGLPGLTLGVQVVTGIVRQFWDKCWPPLSRPKKRISSMQWLVDRVASSSAQRAWTAADLTSSAALEVALADLSSELDQRFGAATVDMGPLRQVLAGVRSAGPARSELPPASAQTTDARVFAPDSGPQAERESVEASEVRARAPAIAPPQQAVGSAQPSPAPASPSALDQLPTEPGAVTPYLLKVGALLMEVASMRFAADRTDPRAYRLLRAGQWLAYDRIPPASARGRTEVSPPNRKLYQALHAAIRAEQWEPALEQSELLIRHNPLWFEGHFFTVSSLEKLGDTYAAARASVEYEVRAFAQRMPALLALQFSDGSPMCPPNVATWLKPVPDVVAPSATAAPAALDEVLRSGLLKNEPAAVEQLRRMLQEAGSARSRFLLTYELAAAHQGAGRIDHAVTLYLALERDIEEHRLWSWEPELAIQVWRALVKLLTGTTSHGVSGVSEADVLRMRAKLAQLAPTILI